MDFEIVKDRLLMEVVGGEEAARRYWDGITNWMSALEPVDKPVKGTQVVVYRSEPGPHGSLCEEHNDLRYFGIYASMPDAKIEINQRASGGVYYAFPLSSASIFDVKSTTEVTER